MKRSSKNSRANDRFMFSAKQISSGQEILALLNCRRLPARLSTGETAVLLGFRGRGALLRSLPPSCSHRLASPRRTPRRHLRPWMLLPPRRTGNGCLRRHAPWRDTGGSKSAAKNQPSPTLRSSTQLPDARRTSFSRAMVCRSCLSDHFPSILHGGYKFITSEFDFWRLFRFSWLSSKGWLSAEVPRVATA